MNYPENWLGEIVAIRERELTGFARMARVYFDNACRTLRRIHNYEAVCVDFYHDEYSQPNVCVSTFGESRPIAKDQELAKIATVAEVQRYADQFVHILIKSCGLYGSGLTATKTIRYELQYRDDNHYDDLGEQLPTEIDHTED